MELIRRQKITIAILAVYWITLAYVAHMRIPELVYQAQVADKWLHFLAYMNMAFLLWFSVRPSALARWRKRDVWLVLFAVVIYGGLDELLQPYFNRSCDFWDFVANAEGAFVGLLLLTFLSFWQALPVVAAITIFGVTNLAHANLSTLIPVTDSVFHILAYGGFALIWIKFIALYMPRFTRIRWFLLALAGPVGLLFVVKGSSLLLGRPFAFTDLLFAFLAIVVVVAFRGWRHLSKGL